MSIFYRIHWADCPPLSAENAWSALWGAERSDDGTQTKCTRCDGTGEDSRVCTRCDGYAYTDNGKDCRRCDGTGNLDECKQCDGTGWVDCVPGYSCYDNPRDLIDYFSGARSGLTSGEQVITFEGRQVDTGFDGEPTAVPERVIETLAWEEFLGRHEMRKG